MLASGAYRILRMLRGAAGHVTNRKLGWHDRMPGRMPIRVLIVDDHPVVRFGLAAIIRLQPDMDVVGEAGSGEDACADLRGAGARRRADGPAPAGPERRAGNPDDSRRRTPTSASSC